MGMQHAPAADAWWVLNPDTKPQPTALSAMLSRLVEGNCDAVGATLELRWAPGPRSSLDDYELVARLASQPGVTPMRVPVRENGTWLIWFTDLPPVDGDYLASVSEIRFRE